jgi:hypothetical protein
MTRVRLQICLIPLGQALHSWGAHRCITTIHCIPICMLRVKFNQPTNQTKLPGEKLAMTHAHLFNDPWLR